MRKIDAILITLLIIPVLLLFGGFITQGANNLQMLRHFDRDEADLIVFAAKTYTQGIIPLEPAVSYPQLFFYCAGLALSPITLFHGIDYRLIGISLRSFNMLILFVLLITLYSIAIRFFKSRVVAFLSCAFLATTPQIFWFAVNSRPHLLSLLFILASFFFCFCMTEKYNKLLLTAAVILSGLATATNLFGIFLIPPICLAYLYATTKLDNKSLLTHINSKLKLIYLFATLVIVSGIIAQSAAIFAFFKFNKWFNLLGITSFDKYLKWRNFQTMSAISIILFSAGAFWLLLNVKISKYVKNNHPVEKMRWMLIINKFCFFLFLTIAAITAIFFICNPSYFVYPAQTAKAMFYQFAVVSMGSCMRVINKPIFISNATGWFNTLFDNNLMNLGFGLLFIFYITYEAVNFKKNWRQERDFLVQRMQIWFFSIFLFLLLSATVTHRPHHYLLPIPMLNGMLIFWSLKKIINENKNKFMHWTFIGMFTMLTIFGFYTRFDKLTELYNIKKGYNSVSDTGIQISSWIKENFPLKSVIWIDSQDFYISPEFTQVYMMKFDDDIRTKFSEINHINPDILIITNEFDSNLSNKNKIEEAVKTLTMPTYKIVNTFEYSGPLKLGETEYGKYKTIYIYVRQNNEK